ncbi:protein SOB FIVE-LIKE 5-like isoform X2 [Lotus japonicus]|uniref:protein SOB FIVE-LIKE 5-like isoform X2 n=1 Tax=Lotus japonicus TaxID=34305 RepID=UPI00258320F7|nr:protein SOB FIVE-LIKE 5-like isoform X2 [Lotus japonicus]
MDMSSSQYNSASESGWTHYFDQPSLSEKHFQRSGIVEYKGMEEEEEEEDLSMVSDASSGPPHYHEEDDQIQSYGLNWYPSSSLYTKESVKKQKVKEYGRIQQPSPLEFDDTASSPVLNCHKANQASFSGNGAVEDALDFSPCFSATRTKRKPKFQKHFSFFGGKQASEGPGGFDEDERK